MKPPAKKQPSRARERNQRDPATERLHDGMRIASARWQQLQALKGRSISGHTDGPRGSDPIIPIIAAFVDHARALPEFISWWNDEARRLLDPSVKWELGVPCPYQADNHPDTTATLIAWPNRVPATLVRCQVEGCATWQGKDEIQRLGEMVDPDTVPVPTRGANLRGARPPWERLTGGLTSAGGDAA